MWEEFPKLEKIQKIRINYCNYMEIHLLALKLLKSYVTIDEMNLAEGYHEQCTAIG